MKVALLWKNAARFAMAVAMVAGLAVSASAQTVLIDFGRTGSFRGIDVPNPDPNGNTWNSITPGPFLTDLLGIDGNPTAIDIGFSTPVGTDSFNGPAGPTTFPVPTPAEVAATDIDTAALGLLGVLEAGIDFAAGPSLADNRVRFELQQLDPSKLYNLSFFSSHKFSTDDTTVFSIYSDNTYSTVVATTSVNHQTPTMPWLHNRDQLATINGIAPQASDILYVEFVGINGAEGYLNSMQITAVPEPSALLLIATVVGACVGFRRR
jgi:hypothetical protein